MKHSYVLKHLEHSGYNKCSVNTEKEDVKQRARRTETQKGEHSERGMDRKRGREEVDGLRVREQERERRGKWETGRDVRERGGWYDDPNV
jgi:hypothetical protein